ncbi:14881_t:CDS:1 [Entrophospora sp. SA101]|nr:13560_t:CDS:1 [Entrophospora sp. SA101]CAJ0634220.1 14881_t:CDS:1 [Entrophospora sp. SA101]CAJ0846140.1 5386_t:CDS:1 [Entrophospora sp. SA101]
MYETLEGFDYNMVVYDLGLSIEQRMALKELKNSNYLSDLRVFNFSKYPSFWDINEGRGEYAWKPGMIKEVSKDYPGTLIWLDSGTKVERFLFKKLKIFTETFDGFVSPKSPGFMNEWTHPGVYDYYKDDHSKYDKLMNCNAAFVIFDTYRVQYLIDEWYDCALVKDCIAPVGSSRVNHRQDQTILTYLAAKGNRYCDKSRRLFGVTIHMDSYCKETISGYESNHPELQ